MSVLLFHFIFMEKFYCVVHRMEILLTVYDLKLPPPLLSLPTELLQYSLTPNPCLYFYSLHPFFRICFKGQIVVEQLAKFSTTCTRSSTSNGRKFSIHKGKLCKVLTFPVLFVFVYIFLHIDECSAK